MIIKFLLTSFQIIGILDKYFSLSGMEIYYLLAKTIFTVAVFIFVQEQKDFYIGSGSLVII